MHYNHIHILAATSKSYAVNKQSNQENNNKQSSNSTGQQVYPYLYPTPIPATSNSEEHIFTSPITLPTQGNGMTSKTETKASTSESVTENKAINFFSAAAQVTSQSPLANTENEKVTTTTTSTPAVYQSTEEAITETTTTPILSELMNQNTQGGNGYQTGVTSRTTATPVKFSSEAVKTATVSSSTLNFPQHQSAEQNPKQDFTNEETTHSNQELTAETTTATTTTTTIAPITAESATVLTTTLSTLNNEVSNAYQANANAYEINGVVENAPYQSIHGNPYINNPPSNVYQTYDNNMVISNTNFNALPPENTYQVNAGTYNINGAIYNEPNPITSSRQQAEATARMGTKQPATVSLPSSTIAPQITKTTTITTTPETSALTTVVPSQGATQTEPIKNLGSESTVTTEEKESNIATGITVTQYPVYQQKTVHVSRQPKETSPLTGATGSSDQNSETTASPSAASSGTSDLKQELTTNKNPSTYVPTTYWYPKIATTSSPSSNTKIESAKEESQILEEENDVNRVKVYDNANPSAEYSYESKNIQSPADISKELPYQDAPKLEVPFQKEGSTENQITNIKVSATTTTAALPYLTTANAPVQTSAPHVTVSNSEAISTTTTEEISTTPGPIFDQSQLYYTTESSTTIAPETASYTPYQQDPISTVANLPDQSTTTGTKYPEESTTEKNQSVTTESTEDSAIVSTQPLQDSTTTIPQDEEDNNPYETQKQEENINTQSQTHTSNSSYGLYGDYQNSQWQILNTQQQQDTSITPAPSITSEREETQKINMAYTASPSEQTAYTSPGTTNKPSPNTKRDLRTTEKPPVTPSIPNPVADSKKAENTKITGIPQLTTFSKTELNEISSQKTFQEINAVQNFIAPTKSPLYELVTNAAINIENAARRNEKGAYIRRPTLSQLLMNRVKGPSLTYFSNSGQSSELLQQDSFIEPDKVSPTENPKTSNLQTAITPSKVTLKNLVSAFTTQASSTGSRKSRDEVQALAKALATNEVDMNFPTEADIYSQIEQYPTIKITKDLSKLNEDISETYEKRENIPNDRQLDNSLKFLKDDGHNDFGSTEDDQRSELENEEIPKNNPVSQYVSDYDKDDMVERGPFSHLAKQKSMKVSPALNKSLLTAVLKRSGQIRQRLTPRSITELETNTNYKDDQLMSRLRKDENIMDLPPANDDIDWGSELPVEAYLKNKEKTLRNYIPGIGAKTYRREQSMEVPYLNFLKKRYFPKTNKVNVDPDLDILPLDSNKY